MQIRFLSGPAGTGKTWQCLEEIRRELRASPEGLPLIFLAPKQATFQLERQLLSGGELTGYTRLQILSFDRFARFVFQQFREPVPKLLSAEGRTMVLRAILNEEKDELTIFRNSSRRVRFAEELSDQLREFQNHGLTPGKIRDMARHVSKSERVRQKLADLAFLFGRYNEWLERKEVDDSDALLGMAADLLERHSANADVPWRLGGLWVDGFAQMTPEERRLLTSALCYSNKATVAFCFDGQHGQTPFSSWYLVSQTAGKLQNSITTRYGNDAIASESLPRKALSRYGASAALAHLERNWSAPQAGGDNSGIRIVECADPHQEAVFCAREILRHVRAGGRFRDLAIILRGFENDYPDIFRRVFRRYEIPYFLDHRQNVSHHPLAELTRGAIRTIAFNWRQTDWFATLKSGLVHTSSDALDWLETEALKRGWEGALWEKGFHVRNDEQVEKQSNQLRKDLVRPFVRLRKALGASPSGGKLARSIETLWEDLHVRRQIETWSLEPDGVLHETVWTQMNDWLGNIELAFGEQELPLGEWLQIIEAGLAGLTVGIIPPVLDQVLIGAVDRSRNPDLKVLFVCGFNENIFPASGAREGLLTEADREILLDCGSDLAQAPALRIAEEQFYGYIACTRPREQLILTSAKAGADGKARNPSRFVAHLQRLFPSLDRESGDAESLEHFCELTRMDALPPAPGKLPADIERWINRLRSLKEPAFDERLDPDQSRALYGNELLVSVSSLERFAGCPYSFFLTKGLKLKEREVFELDPRESGSFQHEVLSKFHEEVRKQGKRWRDLSVAEARESVGRIADEFIPEFRDGLLTADAKNRFSVETYKRSLQDFIELVILWFRHNNFDPVEAELLFAPDSSVPGLSLDLADGRRLVLQGRMDRVDLFVGDGRALAVVIDYKSGARNPDRTLVYHGIQLQLPGYLIALKSIPELAEKLGVNEVVPAGCFFVPLRLKCGSQRSRLDALHAEPSKRNTCQHVGLFNKDVLEHLDSASSEKKLKQFKYSINKDGSPRDGTFAALTPEDFQGLLDRTEDLLRSFGNSIFQGEIGIRPFKKRTLTACQHCDYNGICRFDPWDHKYNQVEEPGK